ncbi:farnesyl-diphosphate synthase [Marinococcus halophilus]|uniref:Farnesyl diphosphate synthase n=1 Tax=Marinococcus halophilus TaxID=1371 RepID=A0A510Y7K1_MARHA|nr:farnesyl diphosphate synthase [Marinococcus halophilus]OZT80967.1 farnesyl-diphosphate synthase [Marinococcus halophilus]GEK59349.1 farnesyl diphosphate synthase [Marinococcus halophilus]
MSVDLQHFFETYRPSVDQALTDRVSTLKTPDTLKAAMLYSLEAGGKRVRPLLALAVLQCYRPVEEEDLPAASAVELIHTYSLVHDDLPSMDDDDWRRGQPTNHRKFGEATAILAGDALQTTAFTWVAEAGRPASAEARLQLVQELAGASGGEGMVGGQMADLEGEKQALNLKELEYIHHHKTGALLTYAVVSGSLIAEAPNTDVENWRAFGRELGLVFQIKDDILDVEGSLEEMGKSSGSDESKEKSTYPKLLTLEGAKEKLTYHIEEAEKLLGLMTVDTSLLVSFLHYIGQRNH